MAQPPRLGKAGNVRQFDFMCKTAGLLGALVATIVYALPGNVDWPVNGGVDNIRYSIEATSSG